MLKYLIKRLIFGIFAIIAAMAIVMLLIYTFMDRDLVFAKDPMFTRQTSNARFVYMYAKWEEYGYPDYVPGVAAGAGQQGGDRRGDPLRRRRLWPHAGGGLRGGPGVRRTLHRGLPIPGL